MSGSIRAEEVVIVGGGIAGLATAVALQRVGKRSLVLERWHELRETGASLSLSFNAWRALDALGVAQKLKPRYPILRRGHVTNLVTGATQEQNFVLSAGDGEDDKGTRVVHRRALLEAMAEELPADAIRFSSKLASIKTQVSHDSSILTVLQLEDGAVINAKAVIGCDGVHSVVAQWLGLAPPRDSGRSAIRGLSVFPEGHGYNHELQQFLSANKRAGFTPVNEHDIYWFVVSITTPKVKELGRNPELIRSEVLESMAEEFPSDIRKVVERSELSSLTWDRLLFRAPWDVVLGRAQRGCVTVAGDAMHPMTPDLGQGGCVALEDAVVLARCLAGAESAEAVEDGMARYVAARRWRAAGVVAASYISGSVQQASVGWWSWAVRLVRNFLFYRFIFRWIAGLSRFDCGSLPKAE